MASDMHDERIVTSGFVVTPETVASRTFAAAFRGWDQTEVRAFLRRVSEELAAAAEREAQLRRLLQEAQTRAAHPEVDEELLTNALGEHAARLLGSAREHAAQIKAEAEAKAGKLLREAEAKISRIRSEADSLLARRVEEVDGVSANLRKAAEADAKALRDDAKADAEAELQAARNQGREMITEARAVRERVLADLARRRHIAEVQLEQLRAARERLLDAYALVRRTLDEATQELKMAEVEARLAADQAARRAPEPPPGPAPMPVSSAAAGAAPSPSAAPAGVGGGPPGASDKPAPEPERPPVTVSRAAATAVRPSRSEPGGARPDPRNRPPGHPGESRPAPASPARRAFSGEPAARSPEPPPPPPPPPPAPPSNRGGPGLSGYGLSNRGGPPGPPPPSRSGQPSQGGLGRPLTSRSEPAAPLPPPSILPRPVPPPPVRAGAPATPATDPDNPPWAGGDPDRVDALFARIKADRAATAAAALAPPAPPPAPPDSPSAPAESAAGPMTEPAGPTTDTADADARPEAPPTTSVAPPAPPAAPSGPTAAAAPARGPAAVADESARNRRDDLLEPLEESLARHLKRVLQDDQNEVLDRLRRKRRRHAANPLPALDEQVGRFREAAEPVLADAVRAGVRFADPTASEAHTGAARVREMATDLARMLAEPLRERLARALGEGGADRDDSDEPSDAVSAIYRQWRGQEVEPLARHHAVIAFSRGAFAAYAAGTPLRWVVDDEAPCPDCDDNDLAGTVLKGEEFPTGQVHPPAHPGCRCILVPAV